MSHGNQHKELIARDPAAESVFENDPKEPTVRTVAYARGPRGVHIISLPEAIERIVVATKQRGSAAPDDSAHFVWLDLVAPSDEEATLMREQLGFHPLAVEDCLRGRQRPKLERYPGHFFMVVYAAQINPDRQRVAFKELHMFIGNGFIATVRDHRIAEVRETVGRWRASPDTFRNVGAIAHALLDDIVDDYFPMVDYFSERMSELEARLLSDSGDEDCVSDLHELRRQLILFRRVVAPERDIISGLVRRDLPFLSPDMVPYFQDIRDHAIRIVEEIDTIRDLVATALEGHTSAAAHQLNQTMRRMTSWSIILMSMNLIASNYGMNFHFMPELDWPFGYPLAVASMLFVGIGLTWFFRRRRWL